MNDLEFLDYRIVDAKAKLEKHQTYKKLYLKYKEKYPDLQLLDSYRGLYFISSSIKDNPKSFVRLSTSHYGKCVLYYIFKEEDITIYSDSFFTNSKSNVLNIQNYRYESKSHLADIFIKDYENMIKDHIKPKRKKDIISKIDNHIINLLKNNNFIILEGSFKKERYESVRIFQ